MTFSLVGFCPRSKMLGVAISSSSPAVAARCAHAKAGVGAVASQNITDPDLGDRALALLADGASAVQALDILRASAPHIEYRQLALVDHQGGAVCFSGTHALGLHATVTGPGVAAAGNLLQHIGVPQAMIDAFQNDPAADLPDRLLAGLIAGRDAGGEAGPVHSAGLLVVDQLAWPSVDLRIDWREEDPITALAELWRLYAPQRDDYIRRAIDPRSAPSFGVAGDP